MGVKIHLLEGLSRNEESAVFVESLVELQQEEELVGFLVGPAEREVDHPFLALQVVVLQFLLTPPSSFVDVVREPTERACGSENWNWLVAVVSEKQFGGDGQRDENKK